MNPRAQRTVGIVAGATLVAAVVAAGLLWREIVGIEAQLATTATRQTSLLVDLKTTHDKVSIQARAIATMEKSARTTAAQREGSAAGSSAGSNVPARQDLNVVLESDPKLIALYLKSFRANLSDRFGPLFQRLGLTPDQIGKWEDLATEQEQKNVDLRAAAAAQGLSYTQDPGIVAMHNQDREQFEQGVLAAVGADVAQKIADGLSSYSAVPNGMVPMVTNIATWAAQTGTPINYQQMGQIGAILASNFTPNPALGGSIAWDKVIAQATATMSGPQLQALQNAAALYQLSGMVRQYYAQPGAGPGGP
jgi:hypothetical protein